MNERNPLLDGRRLATLAVVALTAALPGASALLAPPADEAATPISVAWASSTERNNLTFRVLAPTVGPAAWTVTLHEGTAAPAAGAPVPVAWTSTEGENVRFRLLAPAAGPDGWTVAIHDASAAAATPTDEAPQAVRVRVLSGEPAPAGVLHATPIPASPDGDGTMTYRVVAGEPSDVQRIQLRVLAGDGAGDGNVTWTMADATPVPHDAGGWRVVEVSDASAP